MKKGNLGKPFKLARGKYTQQQLALEFGTSREAISAYETGRAKVPADISRKMTRTSDSPWYVMDLRYQYTGTGPLRLNGERADLHRSSVKDVLLEELDEAKEAVSGVKMANKLKFLSAWEKSNLTEALVQLVDVITGIEHFMGVVCEEAEISYTDVWQKHYKKLISRGYVDPTSLTTE
ncbi:helix-turn-helix transcriptional regulator [Bacillus badius]|uniref:helix-turn-helix transcriptional regulator n=1 Tax=Bacillus badius TaxID=1455 RepID=UPI002E1CB980|nr:helix-turn-helix transcriptional regulator [Bacillus badius]